VTTSRAKRNRGSQALLRTGHTLTKIAEDMGVGMATVHRWAHGQKKPGTARRPEFKQRYGILETWWDEPATTVAKGAKAPPTDQPEVPPLDGDSPPTANEVAELARRTLTVQKRVIEKLENDRDATPLEQARQIAHITRSLTDLAKITGEFERGSWILNTPLFRELEGHIRDVLKLHPEAAPADG